MIPINYTIANSVYLFFVTILRTLFIEMIECLYNMCLVRKSISWSSRTSLAERFPEARIRKVAVTDQQFFIRYILKAPKYIILVTTHKHSIKKHKQKYRSGGLIVF